MKKSVLFFLGIIPIILVILFVRPYLLMLSLVEIYGILFIIALQVMQFIKIKKEGFTNKSFNIFGLIISIIVIVFLAFNSVRTVGDFVIGPQEATMTNVSISSEVSNGKKIKTSYYISGVIDGRDEKIKISSDIDKVIEQLKDAKSIRIRYYKNSKILCSVESVQKNITTKYQLDTIK